MALESIVLLKNDAKAHCRWRKQASNRIAVIGPLRERRALGLVRRPSRRTRLRRWMASRPPSGQDVKVNYAADNTGDAAIAAAARNPT